MTFRIDLVQGYLRFRYEFRTDPFHPHGLPQDVFKDLVQQLMDPNSLQSPRHVLNIASKSRVMTADDLSLLIEMLLKYRFRGSLPCNKRCAILKGQQRRMKPPGRWLVRVSNVSGPHTIDEWQSNSDKGDEKSSSASGRDI